MQKEEIFPTNSNSMLKKKIEAGGSEFQIPIKCDIQQIIQTLLLHALVGYTDPELMRAQRQEFKNHVLI